MSAQGSFERSFTSHYKDLRGIYAKRMQCHGNGMALMQPISGEDCQPVCCGYFDRNGDWNLITRLTTDKEIDRDDYFEPLEYAPRPATDIDIVWQPKTSLGVGAHTIDVSGQTPDALPGGAGADAHIQYTSNSKFGAVLMTTSPVRLRAYNDEALFASWLSRNKGRLYKRYGPELKKYGLWIVTRTYTTQRASINAWMDKNKQSIVSLKAKAAMLGELGEDLDWRDKALDKDWSHYYAKNEYGVVVFIDGIEVGPADWWLEGIRSNLQASSHDRGRRLSRYVPDPIQHQASAPIHQLGPPNSVLKKTADNQSQKSLEADDPNQPRGSHEQDLQPQRQSIVGDLLHPHRASRSSGPTNPANISQAPAPNDAHRNPVPSPPFPPRPHDSSGSSQPPPHRPHDSPNASTRLRHSSGAFAHPRDSPGASPDLRQQAASLALPPVRRRVRDFSGDDGRPQTLVADEDVLQDAGVSSISRSQSLRKASITSSVRTPSMSQSLRRETRSINEEGEIDMQVFERSIDEEREIDERAFDFFSKDTDFTSLPTDDKHEDRKAQEKPPQDQFSDPPAPKKNALSNAMHAVENHTGLPPYLRQR